VSGLDLPPRSRTLIEATPIMTAKSGTKACIELTVYPDGHAGIAVSGIEGAPPRRTIHQEDALPLNNVDELQKHVLAVVTHLARAAGA
jgi:hypothetical protein